MTEKELKIFLRQPYSRANWQQQLRQLFKRVDIFSTPQTLFEESLLVQHGEQFGIVQLEDGKSIALFEVEVADQVIIAKNRVALRDIAARYIDQSIIHGAWVFYFSKKQPDYRLSFISRQSELSEDGQLLRIQTHPKRFTYILGANEPCTTAAQRLLDLEAKNAAGFINIRTVVDAFSVERLSREFFKQYKEIHYNRFIIHLTGEDFNGKTVAEPHEYLQSIFAGDHRAAREFVKKLLGRTIFMFFLQKKGWLGCPADSNLWNNGNPRFVQSLFENCPETERFHSYYLSKLFYEALNLDRRAQNDLFDLTGNRVPFLNGGLFERDRRHDTASMDFPPNFFKDLLTFFEQYNFTIDENSPEEQEIGIDPEMLGHIFENLLEDNKDKGAFYTPKEIVHYMCQESLVQYLQTHTQPELAPDIEALIRLKTVPMNLTERVNARHLTALLEKVKICDPAIGSGAFPIGLLQEIYHALLFLYPYTEPKNEFAPATVKKSIIQNAIYGVDKDGGAVDIARLRFWLALVVDEEAPQPLPNLDYKIMQGDSLLERYAGIPLKFEPVRFQVTIVKDVDLFGNVINPQTTITEFLQTKEQAREFDITEMERKLFLSDKPEEKREIREKLETFEREFILGELQKSLIVQLIPAQEKAERNLATFRKDYVEVLHLEKTQKALKKKVTELERAQAAVIKNNEAQQAIKTMLPDQKPYFLWHLYFSDVFQAGGFDIVIGNPPYIRQEGLGEMKGELEACYPLTYKGTADILVYFIELSLIKLMKPGAQFAFIINNKWIRSGYGKGLRKMLQETRLKKLLDFGDLPVFDGAMAYPCILFFEKNQPNQEFEVVLFEDVPFKNGKGLGDEVTRLKFPIKNSDLNEEQWHLHLPMEGKILSEITSKSVILDTYIEGQAFRGVTTGATEIFAIPAKTKDELIAADPNCAKIIKPMLMGRDLSKYEMPLEENYLIRIEKGFTNLRRGESEPVKWFKTNYPTLYQYFLPYQEKAKKRYDKGDYWWELRACDYYESFEQPKIMYQKFQVSPCFVFDENGLYCNDSMWFIPINDKFLLGYLNSKMGWWCITKYCSRIQNGYQLMYDYLKNIPVPNVEKDRKRPVEQLVEILLFLKNSNQEHFITSTNTMSTFFEEVLDGCVFELYFEEHMMQQGINILGEVSKVISQKELKGLTEDEVRERIRQVYQGISASDSLIKQRMALFGARSPEILLPIMRSK